MYWSAALQSLVELSFVFFLIYLTLCTMKANCGELYTFYTLCVQTDAPFELYIKAVEWSLSQLSCPFASVFPLLPVLGHVQLLYNKSLASALIPGTSPMDPEYAVMYSGWFMHPAV